MNPGTTGTSPGNHWRAKLDGSGDILTVVDATGWSIIEDGVERVYFGKPVQLSGLVSASADADVVVTVTN